MSRQDGGTLTFPLLEAPYQPKHRNDQEKPMKFSVPDMSCGHCTAAIEKSLKSADPEAQIACDLDNHEVSVESGIEQEALLAAFKDAGYDATPIAA
jgi:copper chaperone